MAKKRLKIGTSKECRNRHQKSQIADQLEFHSPPAPTDRQIVHIFKYWKFTLEPVCTVYHQVAPLSFLPSAPSTPFLHSSGAHTHYNSREDELFPSPFTKNVFWTSSRRTCASRPPYNTANQKEQKKLNFHLSFILFRDYRAPATSTKCILRVHPIFLIILCLHNYNYYLQMAMRKTDSFQKLIQWRN